jgi:hypothetical protein
MKETIDYKKITSELREVLLKYDLSVSDAIRMLEYTKEAILTTVKVK